MSAEPYVPDRGTLDDLRAAVHTCRGCDLYRDATQAVFGAGPDTARLVLVGEQPGDREDVEGEPFVGPAGRILDKALAEAGIARDEVYLTNAVKHFKFQRSERGKTRIHKTPGRTEVVACAPWLAAEITRVDPELVVCLGATAAKALHGPKFRITTDRGRVLPAPDGPFAGRDVLATTHPSAVLRARDDRDEVYAGLVADLRVAAA
ncbi:MULTISPECIES: UdgX family uracil-DNA binding protein [Actinokineospora]|uniref:Type-4 uracil-DNA glycosylase n=1 Tax=Actinokineospora fastidiosa TaxID=1816 RepID=A0A918GPI7_9PSEU|nr:MULTISPECIES: UdgX family uracil-DNA binding protein [Actinokineospora]UVS78820.1 uracil-DNA glycosylase family domain protein [Actinokineospora sp. UTMC 2448]GGS47359.1 uracil-DNA glycosylase [Actinokineospora fastidiosa]